MLGRVEIASLQGTGEIPATRGQTAVTAGYFTTLEEEQVTRNIFAFYTLRSIPSMASANPAADPLNSGIFVLGGGLDQADLYRPAAQCRSAR